MALRRRVRDGRHRRLRRHPDGVGLAGQRGHPSVTTVISADDAVDVLAALPVPLIACGERQPVPPGPSVRGAMEVTGATFGRSMQWEGAVSGHSWCRRGCSTSRVRRSRCGRRGRPGYLADPLRTTQAAGVRLVRRVPGFAGHGRPGELWSRRRWPRRRAVGLDLTVRLGGPVDDGAALRVSVLRRRRLLLYLRRVATESADEVSLRLVENEQG
jgi:hypothetical protein